MKNIIALLLVLCVAQTHAQTNVHKYKIGDTAFCGIVFYIEIDSNYYQHGLVCSMADQQTSVPWDRGTYVTTHAVRDMLFDRINAERIVKILGDTGVYAAKVCRNYISQDTTCTNWYLPSKTELSLMYSNLAAKGIGNFATEGYWSSVEYFSIQDTTVYNRSLGDFNYNIYMASSLYQVSTQRKAWLVDFYDGKVFTVDKVNKYHVRAIREFRVPDY